MVTSDEENRESGSHLMDGRERSLQVGLKFNKWWEMGWDFSLVRKTLLPLQFISDLLIVKLAISTRKSCLRILF